jgi:hypothetical protein
MREEAVMGKDVRGGQFWLVWLLWTTGTAAGAALAVILARLIIPPVEAFLPEWLRNLAILALYGAGIGLGQVAVLWRRIRGAGWWVLATAGPLALLGSLASVVSGPAVPVLTWGGAAALLGAGQWWVLRRDLRRAGWWLPAAILGWVAGILAVLVVDRAAVLPIATTAGLVVLFGGGAAVVGAVTGLVLAWLLRGRRSVAP